MRKIEELLELSKVVASQALIELEKIERQRLYNYTFSEKITREMKSVADSIMDSAIVKRLISTNLTIVSEESGRIQGRSGTTLQFIVDPLDGTVNFVRGLAPSAVSIALCDGDQPLFGVIAVYPTGALAWGGREFGAFLNDKEINVSTISDISKSVLCTGFPSRFSFKENSMLKAHISMLSKFGKIRMLGAASNSLLQVAKGSAEMYSEQNIMLWDVAAGLAIVEGAGGIYSMKSTDDNWCYNVTATNEHISI